MNWMTMLDVTRGSKQLWTTLKQNVELFRGPPMDLLLLVCTHMCMCVSTPASKEFDHTKEPFIRFLDMHVHNSRG